MPRDALLCIGDKMDVCMAGNASQGVGVCTQSVALPVKVGAFVRPSMSERDQQVAL